MKHGLLFLLFLALAASDSPEPAISYFSNLREVHVAQPDRQNFFIVDEELWNHSRPDLGDLRLYDGAAPVQFSISEQRAGVSSEEVAAKILRRGPPPLLRDGGMDGSCPPIQTQVHQITTRRS